ASSPPSSPSLISRPVSWPPGRSNSPPAPSPSPSPLDPSATEAQATQEGAFNEETGEINWNCPCLGGMADGPCGPQFKEAFSCFVFSKEEPKGMDCIDRFKGMQDCFRQYPDIYGGELEEEGVERELAEREARDDEREKGEMEMPVHQIQPPSPSSSPPAADVDLGLGQKAASFSTSSTPPTAEETKTTPPATTTSALTPERSTDKETDHSEEAKTARAKEAKKQVEKEHSAPVSETDELVPKAAHDATAASGKGK
ncbi:MAG: hypothetical protein Q9212_007581, partial [Teloschistes hypoglaucus]